MKTTCQSGVISGALSAARDVSLTLWKKKITNQYISSAVVMNKNICFKCGTGRSLNSENSDCTWTYWNVFEREMKPTVIFLSSTDFTLTTAWHLLMYIHFSLEILADKCWATVWSLLLHAGLLFWSVPALLAGKRGWGRVRLGADNKEAECGLDVWHRVWRQVMESEGLWSQCVGGSGLHQESVRA